MDVQIRPDVDECIQASALQFQIMDVVVRDSQPPIIPDYTKDQMTGSKFMDKLPVSEPGRWVKNTACTVNIFGVEENGASALIIVDNFKPYLTYEVVGSGHAKSIVDRLAKELQLKTSSLSYTTCKNKRLYGWVPDEQEPTLPKTYDCIKVYFNTVRDWRTAGRLGKLQGSLPWEVKVDPIMMFFDSTTTVPCGWIRVERGVRNLKNRVSHCGVEVRCDMAQIVPLDRMDIAPLLVASVDIECYAAKRQDGSHGFPDKEKATDRVAIIGTSFWRLGTPVTDSFTILQCVGKCDEVEGATVECFETEAELFNGFRDLIAVRSDPDIVIGYNTFGFDYPYMEARGRRGVRYAYNSRFIGWKSMSQEKELESSALGQNQMTTPGWLGRIDLDVYSYIKSQHKLQVYKLDSVAEHFLGKKKVDLPYQELFECLEGGAAQMAKACFYCAEDCRLPLELCKRLEVIPGMVEMSRVTFTTLNQLTFRGQQIKVFNQLVWYSHRQGYMLNDPPPTENDDGYEGATVIEPTPGFYEAPVATLDFASLYPSIMLAHNLCYSTHITNEEYLGIEGVQYETHNASQTKSYTFVMSTPGVLPKILRSLLDARKKAKRDMASAETYELKALYNARQLAIKISCNSVYGFTGAAKRGMYANVAIADSVTCRGRDMIHMTKKIAEEYFPRVLGIPCQVIYGDTDSIMVHLQDVNITNAKAFEYGEKVAKYITAQFREDVTLEMEKVYRPYLLFRKKRYAGLMYTPNKSGEIVFEKMDAKGVELVRRDNCPWAKTVYESVLTPILYQSAPRVAVTNLAAHLEKLVKNEPEMDQFVLTKQLKKKESYANQLQPHLIVADKITKRSHGAKVPQSGDRLPFFIAEGPEEKISERAEDPTWGVENGVKPDRIYYLTNQVMNAVNTLFEPFEHLRLEVKALFEKTKGLLSLQRENQKQLSTDFMTMAASTDFMAASTHTPAVDALAMAPPQMRLLQKPKGRGILKKATTKSKPR